jgi:hypothetical protein
MFVEEFENDEKTQVIVCSGCDKSVCGPTYKCSHCNFFLHKSCAELPREIHHPLHPYHTLSIHAPARSTCDACDKGCERCFFYRCNRCDFDIDIECASSWLPNTKASRHFSHEEHPLMFVEEFENDEEIQVIVCSGCDQSIYAPAYKCSLCNFFLHKSCAELSPEIQHPVHPNHTLVLQVPSKSKICDVCRRDCDRCFFYHCNSCDFNLDIECSSIWQSNIEDGHQHEFVLIFQQIHFTCELCGEDRNSTAQVCRICQLFVHTACTQKPRSIRIRADRRHLLTLIYSLGKVIKEQDDHVFCQLCYKKISLKYASYYCQQCDFVAHLSCAYYNRIEASSDTMEEDEDIDFEEHEECEELQHFNHEHNLILNRNQVEAHHNKLCEGCIQLISAPFYSCEQCHYFLHSTCARLPLKKRIPSHQHPFSLSAIRGDDYITGPSFCEACGLFSDGFAYICQKCHHYHLDIRCCSIPKIITNEGHQHELFHAISSVKDCNACEWCYPHLGLFVCKLEECDFALGFECATLPLKVKYEHDPHLLSLTYTVENNSGEHYCMICEEERNSNHWFYCCVKCNFTAHTQCVIGWHPYMKYGRNFTRKDHQHPLNFVWKTKNSRPCDACGQSFQGHMALNCTQCKFIVHCQPSCTEKLGVLEELL